jgi:hypothetical protein
MALDARSEDYEMHVMDKSYWSYQHFGALVILMGLVLIVWSWRLYCRPGLLSPDSPSYQVFYALSRTRRRTRKPPADKLTDKEIRYYAAMNLVGGIMLVIVGLISVALGLFYPELL